MKNLSHKIRMMWFCARRSAWRGVGLFAGRLVWALRHHPICQQCGKLKESWFETRCCDCQYKNFLKALAEEFADGGIVEDKTVFVGEQVHGCFHGFRELIERQQRDMATALGVSPDMLVKMPNNTQGDGEPRTFHYPMRTLPYTPHTRSEDCKLCEGRGRRVLPLGGSVDCDLCGGTGSKL